MDYPKNWVDEKIFGVGIMLVWVSVFTIFPIRFWTVPRFSASSSSRSTANDVCVEFSRVRTQATAMVARPIRADVCVRAVSNDNENAMQKIGTGIFPFVPFFFFRSFHVQIPCSLLFVSPKNSFALCDLLQKCFWCNLIIIIHYSYSLRTPAVRVSRLWASHSTHAHHFWQANLLIR